ncbi:MAG TPA: amidoligase family protein [Phycisphaerae bacterium]|nr:amidoligase family protein [Phycisphaerae bacterium]
MATHTQRHEANPKAATISYGVELEVLLPRGSVRVGGYHAGIELGGRFPAGWNAQRDGSLQTSLPNYEGVEIVSPVLRGRDGLEQIRQVTRLLEEMGARVSRACGVHVHIGSASVAGECFDDVADWVRRLLNVTAQHEKALYGAAGTRSRERGTYCRSIRDAWGGKKGRLRQKIKAEDLRLEAAGISRYQSLNLVPLFGRNRTVEYRAFSGSINANKVCAWVQMTLALATLALSRNARFDAPTTGYADTTTAVGAMKRFFYMTGWTRGRKQFYQPVCLAEGWVDDMENLDAAKRELMRLARKYDEQAA